MRKALVARLTDAIRGSSVVVAIAIITLTLWQVAAKAGLEGGPEEVFRFLIIPFIAWMVVALAAKPNGSIVLRGILAFGLVSGVLAGMNGQVDVKTACRTGWVGEECEDFIRSRNAMIPVITGAWATICLVLFVGLWKSNDAAEQSAA